MQTKLVQGILLGLLANAVGIVIYIVLVSDYSIQETLQRALSQGFLGKIIALGAIANILLFFYFIRNKEDYKARGVLLATIVVGVLTMIIKFL